MTATLLCQCRRGILVCVAEENGEAHPSCCTLIISQNTASLHCWLEAWGGSVCLIARLHGQSVKPTFSTRIFTGLTKNVLQLWCAWEHRAKHVEEFLIKYLFNEVTFILTMKHAFKEENNCTACLSRRTTVFCNHWRHESKSKTKFRGSRHEQQQPWHMAHIHSHLPRHCAPQRKRPFCLLEQGVRKVSRVNRRAAPPLHPTSEKRGTGTGLPAPHWRPLCSFPLQHTNTGSSVIPPLQLWLSLPAT